MDGRIFQVTPQGDIIWEYVTPHQGKVVGGKPFVDNLIYRARAVPYDWVPEGTPRSETPVAEIGVTTFRVPR